MQLTCISVFLKIGHSSLKLYMLEFSQHHIPDPEAVKPSRSRGKHQSYVPPSGQADAMNAAFASIFEVIDHVEASGSHSLPRFPTCHLTLAVHAIVSLFRLYFAAVLDSGVNKSDLLSASTVKDRLTELCENLRGITEDVQSISTNSFFKMIVMLQQWFEDHKTADLATPTVQSSSAHDDGHNQVSSPEAPAVGNRALQLLSEVATGKSGEIEHIKDNSHSSSLDKRATAEGRLAELIKGADGGMVDDSMLFDIIRKMST